jgi:hypothetical protein
MIKYSKKAFLAFSVISFALGTFFITIYYALGVIVAKPAILSIVLIVVGVYWLIRYGKGELLIGEDSVVVDGQKIPASSIREIAADDTAWKITIKTWVDKDAVIYLRQYLVFTDKEKIKKFTGN